MDSCQLQLNLATLVQGWQGQDAEPARTSARRCAVTKKRVPRAAAWWGRSGTATASAGGPRNALQAGLQQADPGMSTRAANHGSLRTLTGAGQQKHVQKLHPALVPSCMVWMDQPFSSADQLRLAATSSAVQGLLGSQESSGPHSLSQHGGRWLRPETEMCRVACRMHLFIAAFKARCSPAT